MTTDPADDLAPSWSRDGKWVYFASIRTGRYEVWKVPAGGGKDVQVTLNGGGPAFESADGKSIYYMKGAAYLSSRPSAGTDRDDAAVVPRDTTTGLWKIPVRGGEESQVLQSVVFRAFSLVNDGIYFIPKPGADGTYSIHFLSFATGKLATVAVMTAPPT